MDENAEKDTQTANDPEDLSNVMPQPRNHFLYVSLPINPTVHRWANSGSRRAQPIEALTGVLKHQDEEKSYIYAYFDDGVVRRRLAEPFVARHGHLLDAYLESKRNGTAKYFDFSGGPPYVHPDSRARSSRRNPGVTIDPDTSSIEAGMESYMDDEDIDTPSEPEGSLDLTSDPYEDDDDDLNVRRSSRNKSNTKGISSHVRKSGRRRGPPTSGSDVDNLSSDESDELLSDTPEVVQLRRNNARQLAAKARVSMLGPIPSPSKPRGPRHPRPINQAYGLVKPIVYDANNTDYLQTHRGTCNTCMNSPAHKLIADKGSKKRSKASSFTKMGGWIQCMRCTEAVHWKCLSPADQSDILRAAANRESQDLFALDDGSPPVERSKISYNETTDYICNYCAKGGKCFECSEELTSGTKPAVQEDLTTTELLFRCTTCRRAAHYAHLPNPFDEGAPDSSLIEDIAIHYQQTNLWNCGDCIKFNGSVDRILAWRPYPENAPILTAEEEETMGLKSPWPREYLVKWEGKSFRRTSWVPHGWLVSMSYAKLRHFLLHGSRVRLEHLRSTSDGGATGNEEDLARRRIYEEENGPPLPNRRAQECIPEPWKQVEQVLDIRLFAPHKKLRRSGKRKNNGNQVIESSDESAIEEDKDAAILKKLNDARERSRDTGELVLGEDSTETPLARRRRNEGSLLEERDIDDVVWCYAKWGELEYQEATWDTPPRRGEPGWKEFEEAFQRYIQAQSVFVAKASASDLQTRDNRDEKHFERNKMKITQSYVHDKGLHLRPFQVDGINWLSYQWWRKHPAILADEMGLGKTVQVITFLANLVEKKIWPHLILVPNSTILNWMREFQTWAPQIRAVPYYGEAASRDIIRSHEIFHSEATSGQTRLKLHVLVTTYDTFLSKQEWSTVFKAPSRWEVLIVDEGQRLKNNESLLFQKLNTIQVGHRVLMTGTPLNNNLRELFNLMNFIDPDGWHNLKELETQYQQDTLTADLVSELRERLKDYFLRRTKEILNLPQKHEMIVPVSLTRLQKGIYKSIIEANLALLESLVKSGPSSKATSKTSKANLRNILMQSRKLVQHPYLVEPQLERETDSAEEMHRQLLDASGKLKFLQIMLARLKAKGKRVLLFSQFVVSLRTCFKLPYRHQTRLLLTSLRISLWEKGTASYDCQKEKEAAQEVADSGRGGRRAAKAAVKTYLIDSPDKKKNVSKKKKPDDSDIEYQEPELNGDPALADVTSEDEVGNVFEHIHEIQEDIAQLDDKSLQDQLLLKARKKEQRRQQRLARIEAQRRALEQSTAAATFAVSAAVASTFSSFPSTAEPSTLGLTGTFAAGPATQTREPICNLCNTRHGPNACPTITSLEALKALRVRLVKSPDAPEDKMAALKCLDDDIAEREKHLRQQQQRQQHQQRQQQQQMVGTNNHMHSQAMAGFQSYPAPNKTSAWNSAGTSSQALNYGQSSSNIRQKQNFPATAGMHYSTGSSASSSTANLKRGPEGPSPNEPPSKRVALSVPTTCLICNQSYHPPDQCWLVHADPAIIKRRLDALYANRTTKNTESLQELLVEYNKRLMQQAPVRQRKFITDD
ncbi:hypothetical protein FS842_009210 [Serendipita sp. 407]|nr:hypothetical protein FS842_009210 [Serendipita sp. 407]